MKQKQKSKEKNLIFIFSLILLVILNTDKVYSAIGTSSNNKLRINVNSFAFEQNSTSNFIRSFSDFIEFNFSAVNFYSRFGALNLAPSIPILNGPLNGSYLKTSNTELNWSNSTDPEQFSAISYILEISDSQLFTYANYSNSSIRETTNLTRELNAVLADDAIYYWRIKAYDQYDNSSYSETFQFIVDLTLPAEFNLTSPENDTNSTDTTPALAWQETSELNFLNYTIEISNESDFSAIRFSFGNSDSLSNNTFSSWNSSDTLGLGVWYWRVTAYDKAQNYKQTEFSVYNLQSPIEILTQVVTSTSFQGGGGSGGGEKTQQVAFDIIQPGSLSLYSNDTIRTPIFITNKGGVALRNINLAALTNATNLNLELTQTYIGILLPGQTIAIDLIINSLGIVSGETQNEIVIEANVLEPSLKDSAKFFINLLEFGFGERKSVLDKIEVLENIIEGNPECLELKELLDQANSAISNQQYNKALSLTEAAIQACRDLIASLGKELVIPEKKISNEAYIAAAEALAVIILFSIIYRYYKRRGKKS